MSLVVSNGNEMFSFHEKAWRTGCSSHANSHFIAHYFSQKIIFKVTKFTPFFSKKHSGKLRDVVPAGCLWRMHCVPLSHRRSQCSPVPCIPGQSLLRAWIKASFDRTAFLGVQHINQNFHSLEWGKNKCHCIAHKSHYFNEAFVLIV